MTTAERRLLLYVARLIWQMLRRETRAGAADNEDELAERIEAVEAERV